MKIIFFTQEDPFYVKIFFDEFLKIYPRRKDIQAIVISRPMGKKSTIQLARQMYGLYGAVDFMRVGMRYAIVKIMGIRKVEQYVPGGVKTYTLRQLMDSYGLNVIERSDLNSPEFRQMIKQYDADLFISVASPVIFKKEFIAIPKRDCINIHNAPLPKYRGMLPNFWQLYHGEKESGITIHRINADIDEGDIVMQRSFPINTNETLHDLIVRTKREGARLMMQVINDYLAGSIQYSKMKGTGSYFTFPSRRDSIEFRRRGRRLI